MPLPYAIVLSMPQATRGLFVSKREAKSPSAHLCLVATCSDTLETAFKAGSHQALVVGCACAAIAAPFPTRSPGRADVGDTPASP